MRSSTCRQRGGSLLVCVLVCLGIATSIMLTAVNSSLRARRQVTRELQMEQTRWLVDAGLERGASQLSVDHEYTGESWEVTATLSEHQTATIEIKVTDEDVPDGQRRLSVTASIQGTDPHSQPTRHTNAILFDLAVSDTVQPNPSPETDSDP